MERIYTKTSCPFYASEYCAELNMENCETCTVKCETEAQAKTVRADLDAYRSLMPKGGISPLFATDECVLCRGEKKGKKRWYAFADLANPEPKRHKTVILGIAKEPKAGSLLPVQLGCCDACRRRLLMAEYIVPALLAGFTAIPLAVFSVRSIREPLMAISHGLPFYLFAGCVILGAVLGKLLKKSMLRKYAAQMHLKIMDAPVMAGLKEKGWFELNGEGKASQVVFSKKPALRGLYTAMPENAAEIPENEMRSGENH